MATQAESHNVLQQFVERASSLYSLPAVAMEVLELTARTNVDTEALRRCVERDPALTAKLLRVVNSSMFGLSREVSDLNQALALLGVKPLKLLVLGFSLPKQLYEGMEAETLRRFWRSTLVKAVAARELAQAFWGKTGDEAFIAGLLQEIGVLVLINELGESYLDFLSGVHERGEDLIALETATLGFDHAILSARLLDHWGLPETIVRAVSAPHHTEYLAKLEASEAVLPQVLHLATLIAGIIANGRQDLMPELVDAAARYRQLDVQQLQSVLEKLQEQVDLMANLFAVSLGDQGSYVEIMSRAHEQMSEAAVEALPQMVGVQPGSDGQPHEALHQALDQYAQKFLSMSDLVESTDRATVSERSAGPAEPDRCGAPALSDPSSRSEPGLQGRISSAIARCRINQCELSLMLLEIDDYDQWLVLYGCDQMRRLDTGVRRALEELSDKPCESMAVTDARCAVVMVDCDRQHAIALARSLREVVPRWLLKTGGGAQPVALSFGIATLATPTRSSQPGDLIDAADRCLFAARRSGGRVIKSIDLL